jgi:hypothetical protein
LFEAALLNQVQKRGEKREKKSGVGGEEESDMEEDPAGMDHGRCRALLAGMEGRYQAEKKADGEEEDAEGDGFISPIDEEKGEGEKETKESLGLVGVDR